MRLLITGLSGTLAPVLAREARRQGHAVIGFDHRLLTGRDPTRLQGYVEAQRPDAVAHLAMAGEAESAELAGWAARRGLPFLVTSTAMVFHHDPNGPHAVNDERTASSVAILLRP